MNEKLKHISNYCCEPKSEAEFLAVKLAAKIGGVKWYNTNNFDVSDNNYIQLNESGMKVLGELVYLSKTYGTKLIPVHEYCELLMRDESEFDRRVELTSSQTGHRRFHGVGLGLKSYIAYEGYSWYDSNGQKIGKEVSLVKDEE